MLYQIIINFSLVFTTTVLLFWPFIHYFDYNEPTKEFTKYKPYLIGIAFGIVGILLAFLSFQYLNGFMINIRLIPLLFCGLLGGPISVLIAGVIMIIGRILLFNISEITFLMSINFFVLVVLIAWFSYYIPIKYETISRYFYLSTAEIALVLLFCYNFEFDGVKLVLLHLAFSLITFYTIYWILEQMQFMNNNVKKAYAMKQVDYLTQLPNNYALEEHLNQLIMYSNNFSLLHIDLDLFKDYNYEYSYQVGDQILEEIAGIFQDYARKHDAFIGRVGGDEFIYITKSTPPAIAIYEADNLRKLVEQHTFLEKSGLNLKLTISIGISSLPDNGPSLELLYQQANRALRSITSANSNDICHANQIKKEAVH